MGINDRMIFSTPPAEAMVVTKTPVEGATCPECGGEDVRRYPIGWYKGPRIVVKCQDCYHSLAVELPTLEDTWPPFRAATYDWDVSPAERASTIAPRSRD
jgi:ssDNA-binding Zn-finger/Zn-ribbon topoisomerase 1